MKIQVTLYATLTKYATGSIMHKPIELETSEGSTLEDLCDRLGIPAKEVKAFFVNSTIREPEYKLHEGDHVGIFPPVGGGCMG